MGVARDIVCTSICQTNQTVIHFAMLKCRITVYRSFDEIHRRYFSIFSLEWVRREKGGMMTCDGVVNPSWHFRATANSLMKLPALYDLASGTIALLTLITLWQLRQINTLYGQRSVDTPLYSMSGFLSCLLVLSARLHTFLSLYLALFLVREQTTKPNIYNKQQEICSFSALTVPEPSESSREFLAMELS